MKGKLQILLFCLLTQVVFLIISATNIAQTQVAQGKTDRLSSSMKASRLWRKRNAQSKAAVQTSELSHSELASTLPPADILQDPETHWTQYVAECNMPTDLGVYKMRSYVYSSPTQKLEPIVMVYGDVKDKENVLVRVHDQCFTSEVFGSLRCDCREQLKGSLSMIKEQGGIVIYLQQEGRGIGIANKVAAYALQDQGYDTVDANTHLGFKDEMREYQAVPDILKDMGIKSIRLMTNNPYKIAQLESLGVKINERVSIQIAANPHNQRYLRSKRDKMRHMLSEETVTTYSTSVPTNSAATIMASSSHSLQMNEKSTSESSSTADNKNVGYALGRDTVVAAIEAIREGKVVLVVDDADRENEGDLIMAAEKATPETIGFIVRYSSGVLCVSLEDGRLKELALPPMVVNNEDPKQTAYTISTDYKLGTTTGISAADRALTFRKLVDPSAKKEEFQRPGHVFPLRYKEGGVLARRGHTEASLDLTRLAGLLPGGVLAEVVHDDGSMMRLPALQEMSKEHNLVLTSVQDIHAYISEIEGSKKM